MSRNKCKQSSRPASVTAEFCPGGLKWGLTYTGPATWECDSILYFLESFWKPIVADPAVSICHCVGIEWLIELLLSIPLCTFAVYSCGLQVCANCSDKQSFRTDALMYLVWLPTMLLRIQTNLSIMDFQYQAKKVRYGQVVVIHRFSFPCHMPQKAVIWKKNETHLRSFKTFWRFT